MADRADPHRCYEQSVQCPEAEVDFILAQFKRLRGRPARVIREDFCGSAAVCCEWVRRRRDHQAFGVDLDRATLDWAEANNLAALRTDQRSRVTLLNRNVLSARTAPVDAVLAMNFSYFLITDRAGLKQYFSRVRRGLKADGVFFLDAYGGYESFKVCREVRRINSRLTYIWNQAAYNPITGVAVCHIDFKFSDGSRLSPAFTYRWRIWTIPEIREILLEAGFRRVTVYWEGADEQGEGDGDFQPAETADADAGWICYITAEP